MCSITLQWFALSPFIPFTGTLSKLFSYCTSSLLWQSSSRGLHHNPWNLFFFFFCLHHGSCLPWTVSYEVLVLSPVCFLYCKTKSSNREWLVTWLQRSHWGEGQVLVQGQSSDRHAAAGVTDYREEETLPSDDCVNCSLYSQFSKVNRGLSLPLI